MIIVVPSVMVYVNSQFAKFGHPIVYEHIANADCVREECIKN